MRFRAMPTLPVMMWILCGCLQITNILLRVHHIDPHFHPTRLAFNYTMLALWSGIILLYLHMLLFSKLELEPTALSIRRAFWSSKIPYDHIVAIRPALKSSGRRIRNGIELETARISADIYPHNYLVFIPAQPDAFAHALHQQAPKAQLEDL